MPAQKIKTGTCWVIGLLLGLAILAAAPVRALSPADPKAVTKALDAEANVLREEGTEIREARNLVEAKTR